MQDKISEIDLKKIALEKLTKEIQERISKDISNSTFLNMHEMAEEALALNAIKNMLNLHIHCGGTIDNFDNKELLADHTRLHEFVTEVIQIDNFELSDKALLKLKAYNNERDGFVVRVGCISEHTFIINGGTPEGITFKPR